MEGLCDPTEDRVVRSLSPPPHRPLDPELLFMPDGTLDFAMLKTHLQAQGRIWKADFIKLIDQAKLIFRGEGNLLELQDPVTVVGDIHGQFYDLLCVLQKGGDPAHTKYLFLGDYVDRGSFSIEVIILLYALKICYPQLIHMIRGNHECRQMTSFFNFRQECLYKYDIEIYDRLMDSFDTLPIACLINGKFLAVHGGISPQLETVEDFEHLNRFREPPRNGLYCDLLWADPVDSETGEAEEEFALNEVRGCSYNYSASAVKKFLQQNELLSIIRAHEAQIDGYKLHKWDGSRDFPVVITVFSAPNYCDVYHNKGAIIKLDNDTLTIEQYGYTEHPYLLPNFMDVFTWSVPFVTEKVLEIFACIMRTPRNFVDMGAEEPSNQTDADQELPSLDYKSPEAKQRPRYEVLRKRIQFVGRMMRMVRTLREENEQIVMLKGLCPDNKIPKGLLFEGHDAIENAVKGFQSAREADKVNEKHPELAEI